MNSVDLVLASSSVYRKQLLSRLGLSFTCISPNIDETPLTQESPKDQVLRLSQAKAECIAKEHPNALIIASDQVASANSMTLYKPGNHENAVKQLKSISNQKVVFYTGLSVIHYASQRKWLDVIQYSVMVKPLTETQIERYLRAEKPYDCAGSFKSEGMGVTLFTAMQGDDPTALIGLPLIRLTEILNEAGLTIP